MRHKCTVTTSWDDGHVLDVKLAALLRKYDIAGTFYVCPKDREFSQRDLLTRTQLRAISKHVEIGGHTMTHPHLSRVPLAEAEKEIRESKTYLETLLEKPMLSFCYPGGYYNREVEQLVQQAGFVLGRTTQRYAFAVGNNPFALPTTFHTYNHYSDIHRIVRFAGWDIHRLHRYTNWEYLAKDLFDQALATGSVFHLWGHSWELEKFGTWEILERVLQYISHRSDVRYVPNSALVQ